MKIRQTVRKSMKETSGRRVRAKSEERMCLVIIFREVEVEPNSRLAPCKELVTAREVVGEDKCERQWKREIADKIMGNVEKARK